ncbi:Alpha/beta hydrolase fold-1 [Aspergillus leporis]|uniref:Alpha/beta hydrolase fold-1 n=1 Tax=Aspergillus leporis TaxID=41062 RepID=A0A5N5WVA9_9EURO|nr:Alpha/beta hydrolase fold-1 [Aspergillus leporis]
MSSKPKIVLVPGAWITPAFYDRLQSCLSERGLDSVAVQHQSTGAEPPIKTLEDDVSQLRGTLEQLCDAGSDVIVAAHSYGGVVSSGAVLGLDKTTRQSQGKSGGVVMIVYMVAFVLQKGDSLIGATGGQLLPWIKAEGGYAYNQIGPEGAYHDLPPSERAQWTAALTHTCTSVFSGTVSYEPWHVIPTAYIMGEEDQMLPMAFQEHMVGILGTSRIYRLKTSHHPFLSMPPEVTNILEELSNNV